MFNCSGMASLQSTIFLYLKSIMEMLADTILNKNMFHLYINSRDYHRTECIKSFNSLNLYSQEPHY